MNGRQVAAMSGVTVRTLHFYDETGLLKPAYHGANSYRFYESHRQVLEKNLTRTRSLIETMDKTI